MSSGIDSIPVNQNVVSFPNKSMAWYSFFSAGKGRRNYNAIDLFEGDPDKGSTTYVS